MPRKVNPKNSTDPVEENAPKLNGEKSELSESAKSRQDARHKAVGDASDGKVTKGHNQPEKGGSEKTFPGGLSDSVKARQERLKNGPVGDASQETDGKVYGRSNNPDDIEKYKDGSK